MPLMAKSTSKRPVRGRPVEGRIPFWCHVLPRVAKQIDEAVDKSNSKLNSRGKIIEREFSVN